MTRRAPAALPLRLFLLAAASAMVIPISRPQSSAPTPPRATYKVSGTVVNAITSEPLQNARVFLRLTSNRSRFISMLTSDSGRFEFDDVPAGKFSLEAAARGFIAAAYNQHEQFSTAIVTGAGISTENLTLRLMPLASISGVVLDDHGEPVSDANLSLFLQTHRGGMFRTFRIANASTDDLGSFEFPFIGPGTYFLSATARPWYAVHPTTTPEAFGVSSQRVDPSLDVVFPTTFYGGATDSSDAASIQVRGGDHVQADIHLSPLPALHVIMRTPPTDDPNRAFYPPILERRIFDSPDAAAPETVNPVSPGVVELTGIPPGNYSVRFQEMPKGANSVRESAPVQMSLTENGQELDPSRAQPTATIKLTAKLPRDDNPPRQIFFGLQSARGRVISFQQLDPASNQLTFDSIPPGKYSIRVNNNGKPYAVSRLLSGDTELPGAVVDVVSGASLDLTADLVAGVVSVEGVVHKAGKPVAGVMIALVPKDPETHLEFFRRDQSDLDGTFVVRGVIPGQYTIIAVEDAWGFEWLKPGVLSRYLQHGQTLNIGELMHNSVYLPEPLEVQPRQ